MGRNISIAIGWVVMWMVTWPALLADLQGHRGDDARENYRSDLGTSMFFAAIPPMWVVAPFTTGFYQHGFQIFPKGN